MKWIFLTLVLANLAYLGYNLTQPAEESLPTVTMAGTINGTEATGRGQSVPEIQLLSERSGVSDRELEQKAVLENPVLLEDATNDDVSLDVSSGSNAGSSEQESTPEMLAGKDAAEDEPRNDPGSPLESAVVAAPEPEPVVVEVPAGCQSLGPLPGLIAATDVSERLNGVGLAVQVRAIDRPSGNSDYRVVLPPLPSLQEAFRRLRELKSRDIDSYVITEGVDAQGISLGVFSRQASALLQQQNLAAEGYETRIREIPRVEREYWLYTADGVRVPDYQLSALTVEFPGIIATETDCLN